MTKGSCSGSPWEDGKANKPSPVGIALPLQLILMGQWQMPSEAPDRWPTLDDNAALRQCSPASPHYKHRVVPVCLLDCSLWNLLNGTPTARELVQE